ncbi:MAG: hypothetical protein ACNI3A_18610 [Desulfovibrio sp.]|uniref:hypothetical protein n=1 Tax=Desulfovibrio sp. 7SRBS1 TaxID=3378064 RepID=UPI003B3CF4F8
MQAPRQRMWTIVRKLSPSATVADVEQLAAVEVMEAQAFLNNLEQAGYVSRREGNYALCRDTGPNPPTEISVRALADENNGEINIVSAQPDNALQRLKGSADKAECTSLVVLSLGEKKRFDLQYAMAASGLDRKKTLRVLNRLEREGFLKLVDETKLRKGFREFGPAKKNPMFQIVKDPASRPTRQPKKEVGRDVLWRLIRRMRRFTYVSLTEASGCTHDSVQNFVRLLVRDGWVRQDGQVGRCLEFVIVNDPGPARPVTHEPKKRRA